MANKAETGHKGQYTIVLLMVTGKSLGAILSAADILADCND